MLQLASVIKKVAEVETWMNPSGNDRPRGKREDEEGVGLMIRTSEGKETEGDGISWVRVEGSCIGAVY